jgi:orotidine-5'-phosphate decarboxylase
MTNYFGNVKTGIVFAADLPTLRESIEVIDQVVDLVDVIKVCSPLVYKEGASSIRILAEQFGKPVFADLKVADVPHTSAKIVDLVRTNGGSAVMVHGFIGVDGIDECLEAACGEVGIIIQIELTNPGGKMFTQPVAEQMAQLYADMPIFGIQAPGNRPERIRRFRDLIGLDKVVVCCGVGKQGGSYRSVMESGGTYAIVGRSIYESSNPRRSVEELMAV